MNEEELEILELIKQYISTSFSGEIIIDCKRKDPVGHQKLLQWVLKLRQDRYKGGGQ